jgi:hypothetical protein
MALEIEEWEIWHTYATFLEATEIDLVESARRLVASGIADCAMLRDGSTYWRSNGAVEHGSTFIDVDSLTGQSTFRLHLDGGSKAKPDGVFARGLGAGFLFPD